MKSRWLLAYLILGLLMALGGCAGPAETLTVGQREGDLVARFGPPQEVHPGPSGGKIFVYTSYGLEPTAAMGGGAWNRPEQVHYWLDQEGVITRVIRYPYGKRHFLLSRPGRDLEEVGTAALPSDKPGLPKIAPSGPGDLKGQGSGVSPGPAAMRSGTAQGFSPPGVKKDMEAASRLELHMTRDDVRQLLGPPERTEGFRVGNQGMIVWFYLLEGSQGRRVLTPLVFEGGRLSGWGEEFYRQRLRQFLGQGAR